MTPWLRGARCTDPEEMPEKEARPPTQNRHGGAPRGERVPLDARRASPGTARRAPKRATTGDLRLSALRSPLMGVDGKETSKTPARKRAAGTKKTALFDIVNRNIAAMRLVPAERVPRRVFFGHGRVRASGNAASSKSRPHPEERACRGRACKPSRRARVSKDGAGHRSRVYPRSAVLGA